jgi:hypothetical protein
VGDVELGTVLLGFAEERKVEEEDGLPLPGLGLRSGQLFGDPPHLVVGALAQVALVLERHRVEHHEGLVLDEEQPIRLSKVGLESSALPRSV